MTTRGLAMGSDVAGFTPGPWETASRLAFGAGEVAVEPTGDGDNGGMVIALCSGTDAAANARLIAASSDGYGLAEWIESHWGNQDLSHEDFRVEVAKLANAYLAKARGEVS